MAEASERLSQWSDPVFGDLVWDERSLAWIGQVEFAGRPIRLELDPDLTAPTREEQLAIIEPSRSVLDGLRVVEAGLRRQAAKQIAQAVIEQQNEVELPEDEFANNLELECISIHGCGEIHYRSPAFFPGQHITVFFNEDLTFGDAAVYA